MKKRIVFTLPNLHTGGAERVMINLMNRLDRTRFDPVLICVNKTGPLLDLLQSDIRVIDLGHHGHILLSPPALLRALRRERPDMIVSTMAPMNFAVLMLRPFLKARIIVREAITPSFFLSGKRRFKFLIRWLYRILYPLADLIIAPAEKIIDGLRDDLAMTRLKFLCLPNPVDIESLRKIPLTPWTDPDTIRFVAAGRLHPQKGFDLLFPLLKGFNPGTGWTLDIYGEGPDRDNLQAMINDLGLSTHITLRGLSHGMGPIYAAADCFLLPSRWEGLPNVVLEALACGTCVIATASSGGIAEIVARAASGDVMIADTMADFVTAMATIRHEPIQSARPAKLPVDYQIENVIKRFETILDQT